MAEGNGSFRWIRVETGHALVCVPLAPIAPHLFTARDVADEADPRDYTETYTILARALGVRPGRIRDARQVHGTAVWDGGPVTAADAGDLPRRPDADILVSRDPDEAVVVRVADCVPILLADVRTGSVAAVHAGWRGTCAGAAGAAVAALTERYATDPSDIVAAVGPSIGPCCYQVGPDVRSAFEQATPVARLESWFAPDGDRWRLDLWIANRQQLLDSGVRAGNIHLSRECTVTAAERYHSYRREGPRAGRMFAAVRAGKGATCGRQRDEV